MDGNNPRRINSTIYPSSSNLAMLSRMAQISLPSSEIFSKNIHFCGDIDWCTSPNDRNESLRIPNTWISSPNISENLKESQRIAKNSQESQGIRNTSIEPQRTSKNLETSQTLLLSLKISHRIQKNPKESQGIRNASIEPQRTSKNLKKPQRISKNLKTSQTLLLNLKESQRIQKNPKESQCIRNTSTEPQKIWKNRKESEKISKNRKKSQRIAQHFNMAQGHWTAMKWNSSSSSSSLSLPTPKHPKASPSIPQPFHTACGSWNLATGPREGEAGHPCHSRASQRVGRQNAPCATACKWGVTYLRDLTPFSSRWGLQRPPTFHRTHRFKLDSISTWLERNLNHLNMHKSSCHHQRHFTPDWAINPIFSFHFTHWPQNIDKINQSTNHSTKFSHSDRKTEKSPDNQGTTYG